jgi:hypothetical protein
MRHLLVGWALAGLLVSCGGESLPALCSFTSAPLATNALTLRPDARLDRAGAGFVLLATGKDQVLAEALGPKGESGLLATIPVPSHSDGPWVGVVGTAAAPATSLVVAYAANASAGSADLMTFTVGVDGSAPTIPVAIGKIPDQAVAPVVVTAGSGRAGHHAGLAWGLKGATTVFAKILGADGRPVGAGDQAIGTVEDFDCLRFGPGQGDLTISYVEPRGTPPVQTFHVNEIDDAGVSGQAFSLGMGDLPVGCAAVAPTASGYAIAWKQTGTPASPGVGDFFALFDQTKLSFNPAEVLSNARSVGGMAPPIVGVGPSPRNRFTLLFERSSGPEAWNVDFEGRQVAEAVVFPSSHGNIGAVSTQPGASSLFATYADYASADPTDQTAGTRLFIELSCQGQ